MSTLVIEQQGPVTRIKLNRPDVHNAMNEDMIRELSAAFQSASTNSAVRAIVLSGNGASFCAGADLNFMKSAAEKSRDQNIAESMQLAGMLAAIQDCSKPVIAVVHGGALGGGTGLLSAADITLAHQNAQFSFSEVKLGMAPCVISPFVMQRIGAAQARRYFLTGERFNGVTAKAIGLVHETFDDTGAEALLAPLLQSLMQNSPNAMIEVKKLIRANLTLTGQALTGFTAEQIADLRGSSEAQEGMRAFFEKRKPAYNLG